jgi:NAD(P)-dependent dehydrogenase (short-subunit alcohol dehydrogenase family)
MNPSCALPLRGRNAVITGGAKGIGLAIAHRLAADGAAIALIGRMCRRWSTPPTRSADATPRPM